MRDPLLPATHAQHLPLPVHRDAEACLHEIRGRAAKGLRSAKGRVAVGAGVAVGSRDRLDDFRRRGLIRIADAKVDQ